MDRLEEDARRMVAPLRPRVSLASGSVMVLLTLLLPIGYQSCGPETKGYELLQGKGDWPTFVGITLSEYFGPAFYGVLLLLAAGTLVLCMMSVRRPAVFQARPLVRRAGILSGMLSLFLLSDVAAVLPIGLDEYGAAAGALIILSCLLPGLFWPKGIYWRWFGLLIVLVSALAALAALNWIAGDVPAWILLGIWAIYGLGPQALWWAHLSGRWKSKEDWIRLRRGLVVFYFPAAIANAWFIVVAVHEGLWGFIPCCFGLHLISLGYMRLENEHSQKQPQETPGPAPS
jgi:hypothetical protein